MPEIPCQVIMLHKLVHISMETMSEAMRSCCALPAYGYIHIKTTKVMTIYMSLTASVTERMPTVAHWLLPV